MSTNRLDAAFEDRFIKISVDYMRSDQEVSLILQRVEGINKMDAEALVREANALRAAEQNGTLSVSLSTRQVLDAAAYCTLGYTSADVINKVILSNYIIADELDTARTILQAL